MGKTALKAKAGAMATVGKSYFIYINCGSGEDKGQTDWVKVGGQRGGSLSRKADSIDASHKDSGGWKTTLPGLKEWSIELDTMVMPNDEGLEALNKAFLADEAVHLKFEYPDKKYITGWASVTEMSLEAPHDDAATYKGTLSGIGPLSELHEADD